MRITSEEFLCNVYIKPGLLIAVLEFGTSIAFLFSAIITSKCMAGWSVFRFVAAMFEKMTSGPSWIRSIARSKPPSHVHVYEHYQRRILPYIC